MVYKWRDELKTWGYWAETKGHKNTQIWDDTGTGTVPSGRAVPIVTPRGCKQPE